MSDLPYQTRVMSDGRYKTLTTKIWTISDAKIVAEEQFEFLKMAVHIYDAQDRLVMTIDRMLKKTNLYDTKT